MRRWLLRGGLIVIALAAVAAAVFSLWPTPSASDGATGSAASPLPSAPAVAVVPPTQVAAFEQKLASAEPSVVADVLAPAVRQAYLKKAVALLPSGSTLRLDFAHAVQLAPDLLRVPAVVSGPKPGTWTLALIQLEGKWLVLGTDRQ